MSSLLFSAYDHLAREGSCDIAAIALAATLLHAQDQIVEITPTVVMGTFELRREPAAADSFTKYLERQIEAKRMEQEAADPITDLECSLLEFDPDSSGILQCFPPTLYA